MKKFIPKKRLLIEKEPQYLLRNADFTSCQRATECNVKGSNIAKRRKTGCGGGVDSRPRSVGHSYITTGIIGQMDSRRGRIVS